MVKKQIILQIIVLVSIACCGQNQSGNDFKGSESDWNKNGLIGSVWEKKGEFCSDSLHFYPDEKYEEYYCEFQEHARGEYQIKADTVVLIEYQLSSEVITNNPEPKPTYVWKYLFVEARILKKIYYEDLNTGYKSNGVDNTWKYNRIK